MIGKTIHITGVVQGVGFRPFVYKLARQHGLVGWVRNTSAGVDIRAEGEPESLQAFLDALTAQAPPLARIDSLTAADSPPEYHAAFEIRYSEAQQGAFQPISPDIALCADCRHELLDPADRRCRYPFINCTNCGPRFTIITDIPYDRPLTTMADFALCAACEAEYHDPADRRFHAQPVACPDCGPQVWLEDGGGTTARGDAAIRQAVDTLRAGKILAIKGLGGFHLACDATNAAAVTELRRRKGRVAKPFALMMADLEMVKRHCLVSEVEARMLTSPAAPIVLLRRRPEAAAVAAEVAPGQAVLGVMLPYTPLHVLLFEDGMPPLVMTSGNLSEEPIVTDNAEARARLPALADAFLMHDRSIHIRTDDSVMRVFNDEELPVRRSRGYAPYPVRLPFDMPPMLAVGAELKNTFCVTRDSYAFMSHHIGDLENYETALSFEQGITHFERLFRIQPQQIIHDQHPDYLSTRYAQTRAEAEGLPRLAVQHHHAHIAACMAENRHPGDRPVIGVCFDGTGYGTDGTIWGGEFLIADYRGFERAAHLKPLPLPGGDAATRKPARIALAYLLACGLAPDDDLPPLRALPPVERDIIHKQVAAGLNTPLTSSMGRLFDAVSALAGICQAVTYEGQAAIELEAVVDPAESGAYDFDTADVINPADALRQIVADYRAGVSPAAIAARFHNGAARMIRDACLRLSERYGLDEVALSGGVFQNVTLLGKTLPLLCQAGLRVYTHRLVPPNDGGLALGQAAIGFGSR
ncbi:MAG: carbamoyltransferase HypF [Chloroflexi bacterium]|nr:carbamoyltransferase HypF [Chloroflexota bacterium]MDL1882888.1 carbamoyltransferase HypF [Anaerolineae bacterium CFX8]